MAEQKIVGYDLNIPNADGTDNVTTALRTLVNDYPGLSAGDEIEFGVLEVDSGRAMFPTSSVAILSEKEDITGHVEQKCAYPFLLIYRTKGANENRKAAIKEWLDNFGRWLEKQEIVISGQTYKLDKYPALKGDREFLSISRQTQSYLYGTDEDKTEDWAISIQALYRNEFDRD